MGGEIGILQVDERPLVHLKAGWRSWLERNRGESSGAWLVSWKKTSGKPFVPYREAVDEALCFGWVDSRPNRLDEQRAMRLFTPRNPASPWSRLNKEKVARPTAQRLMAPAGMRPVQAAKANGAWSIYDDVEELVVPPDLAAALAANEAAKTFFRGFPASSSKNILWWIKSARRSGTRAARVARTVELAAENRMANHPTGRDREPTPRPG